MHVALADLANGAMNEIFQACLEQITDNIYDPNTTAGAVRKLSINVTFKPDKSDRDIVKYSLTPVIKLAPMSPVEGTLLIGYDARTKRTSTAEFGSQMKGQLEFNEDSAPGNVVNFK